MWIRLDGKLYNLDRVTSISINDYGLYFDDILVKTDNYNELLGTLTHLNELLVDASIKL